MNDYIARFRVNDFEKQELKEHIREVQKLAAWIENAVPSNMICFV